MFKVSIRSKELGQFLNLISAINGEARFNFSETGLNVRLVDNANVAMGIFSISPEGFDAYEVQEPVIIGIDIYGLLKIIDKLDPSEICTISQNKEKTTFEATHRWFDITKNVDSIRSEPKMIKSQFSISFLAHPKELKKDFKFCNDLSNNVEISYCPGTIVITAMDDEGKIKFKSTYQTSSFHEFDKMSRFTLEYCIDLVSGIKYKKEWICEEVKVSMDQDFPLSIEGNSKGMSFRYLLAPRIESA